MTRIRAVRTGAILAAGLALALGPAQAGAAYTSAPVANVFPGAVQPVPGTLMTGDDGGDVLTITVGLAVLAHDRFGVDPGFASATDFDTNTAGTQEFPSSFATRLMVDGGAGQDTLRFVDGRTGETNWLHAGSVTGCVQETVGNQPVSTLCYRAATIESLSLDSGAGDDRIASLDGPPTTLLTLAGGDGDDSMSQDGEDGVHVLDSPVSLIGGPGTDEAAFTEDQSGSLDYTIGGGQFAGTGYAPVSYDETAEFLTLYTRLGPDNNVTITEQGTRAIAVWSAGGTVNARNAGAQTEVLARPSLFALDDQGGINFRGGPGSDVLFGTDAADRGSGGGGADQLNGEGGPDRLNGGAKQDLIYGGDDRDRISARDKQRDLIDCGAAKDRAKIDRREGSLRACEILKRPRARN